MFIPSSFETFPDDLFSQSFNFIAGATALVATAAVSGAILGYCIGAPVLLTAIILTVVAVATVCLVKLVESLTNQAEWSEGEIQISLHLYGALAILAITTAFVFFEIIGSKGTKILGFFFLVQLCEITREWVFLP
jgi:hypothetical protein